MKQAASRPNPPLPRAASGSGFLDDVQRSTHLAKGVPAQIEDTQIAQIACEHSPGEIFDG